MLNESPRVNAQRRMAGEVHGSDAGCSSPELSAAIATSAVATQEPAQRQETTHGEDAGLSGVAIHGAEPVQLKLPSLPEFIYYVKQEESQAEQISGIQNFLALYVIEREKTKPNIKRLFSFIDFLDKSINRWFDAHKAPDMKEVPNGPYLLHLHEEVAKEHQGLVEIAYRNPDKVLPVNLATLTNEEAIAVHKIWKSIVSGSGNISVVGTSEFQKKTYADLARLLQGRYGRAMVQYLDGGEVKLQNRTTIGENFDDKFGDKEQPLGSYAYPRANLKDDKDTSREIIVEKTDLGYKEARTRDDINRLMLEGEKGVNHNGVSYTFGKGSGSLVKIAKEDGNSLTDEQLNQILTPSYITLGHELGHAMRNRGGGSFAGTGLETIDKFFAEEEGVADEDTRSLWTDAEEVVNITTSEKKLRQEHELSERRYHATQGAAAQARFQQALEKLLKKVPDRKYVTCSNVWQNQILPAIRDDRWTGEKLRQRLKILPGIESNVFPQAKKKYAIEKQLMDLYGQHTALMSRSQFTNIREVQAVLTNLLTEGWDEEGCKEKVTEITKMMEDKAWWRNAKIGGGIVATLATVGIGVYLKYFKK